MPDLQDRSLTSFVEGEFTSPQFYIIVFPSTFENTGALARAQAEVLLDKGASLVYHILVLFQLRHLKQLW